MGNFDFLEKINKDIADTASTAEKLFRDEYFEQCITQTRKLAELMTKTVLGEKAESDDTFDDMLYKLKTISTNNFREQEFISDMYFLKKQGNLAVHTVATENDNKGKTALECLEHAFEASVNYAYAILHDDNINRLIFDEKLLMTGEKNTSLQEDYKNALHKEQEQKSSEQTRSDKKTTKPEKIKKEKREKQGDFSQKNNNSFFSKLVKIIFIIGFIVFITLFILSEGTKIRQHKSEIKPQKVQKTIPAKSNLTTSKPNDFSMSKNFSKMR